MPERICSDISAITSSAGMAELADAPDLGSGVPDVQVQVLLPAVIKWLKSRLFGVRVA